MPLILQSIEGLVWRSVRFFPQIQKVRQQHRAISPTRRDVVAACESGDVARAQQALTDFLGLHTQALLDAMTESERSSGHAP
jgi:DNA-binding FadR family transcriptional regulator